MQYIDFFREKNEMQHFLLCFCAVKTQYENLYCVLNQKNCFKNTV